MIQEVTVGAGKNTKEVLLDTEKTYLGRAPENDAEKDIRRALNLPITKQLVY